MLFVENIIKDVVLPATNRLFNKRTEQPEKPKKNLNVFLNSAINDLVKNRTAQASEAPEPRMFDDDLVVRARTSGQEERKYDYNVDNVLKAIAYNETRNKKNPYSFIQPSGKKEYGNALGKYQVVEAELKNKAKEFLGRNVSAKEFLENPELQDEYMRNKMEWFMTADYMPLEGLFALHRRGYNEFGDKDTVDYRIKLSNETLKDNGEPENYSLNGVNYYNSL